MSIDWEGTLGSTSYEDAVDIAARALEKMKEREMEAEEEQHGEKEDADESVEEVELTKNATSAKMKNEVIGCIDDMDDEEFN